MSDLRGDATYGSPIAKQIDKIEGILGPHLKKTYRHRRPDEGSDMVVDQSPPPGSRIRLGEDIALVITTY